MQGIASILKLQASFDLTTVGSAFVSTCSMRKSVQTVMSYESKRPRISFYVQTLLTFNNFISEVWTHTLLNWLFRSNLLWEHERNLEFTKRKWQINWWYLHWGCLYRTCQGKSIRKAASIVLFFMYRWSEVIELDRVQS